MALLSPTGKVEAGVEVVAVLEMFKVGACDPLHPDAGQETDDEIFGVASDTVEDGAATVIYPDSPMDKPEASYPDRVTNTCRLLVAVFSN